MIVNGTPIVHAGKHTGKLPGTVPEIRPGHAIRWRSMHLRDKPAQRAAE